MKSAIRNRSGKGMSRIAVLLALALAASSSAQEPTFRARSNVVTVPVLVRDEHGQAVYGLNAADFLVQDDGVAQTVKMDEAADSEPISMVVALQTGSPRGPRVWAHAGTGGDARAYFCPA